MSMFTISASVSAQAAKYDRKAIEYDAKIASLRAQGGAGIIAPLLNAYYRARAESLRAKVASLHGAVT
jgi:hypothetical protein